MITRCLLILAIWVQMSAVLGAVSGNERRVALIIGNSNYTAISVLPNAVNDAVLIKTTLDEIGFETTLLQDAAYSEMVTRIGEFRHQLKTADVGLFYYAGHAVEVNGENQLVPIDVTSDLTPESMQSDTINAGRVVDTMGEAENPVNIIVLDSCRNNPFAGLSGSGGLAKIDSSEKGLFVAFSTAPGKVASDGLGGNSPYTEALSRYMLEPGLSIHEMFASVRLDVMRETRDLQTPWEQNSLTSNFYFAGEVEQDKLDEAIEVIKKEELLAAKKRLETLLSSCKDFQSVPEMVKETVDCFKEVLAMDKTNDVAKKQLFSISEQYQRKLKKEIKKLRKRTTQEKLLYAKRSLAVLTRINPKIAIPYKLDVDLLEQSLKE